MTTDTNYLLLGGILPLFLLGALFFSMAVVAIRRGEIQYRGSWLIRRHDGLVFWLVVSTAAVAGLTTMSGAAWLGATIVTGQN